jgi:hypothetical protein
LWLPRIAEPDGAHAGNQTALGKIAWPHTVANQTACRRASRKSRRALCRARDLETQFRTTTSAQAVRIRARGFLSGNDRPRDLVYCNIARDISFATCMGSGPSPRRSCASTIDYNRWVESSPAISRFPWNRPRGGAQGRLRTSLAAANGAARPLRVNFIVKKLRGRDQLPLGDAEVSGGRSRPPHLELRWDRSPPTQIMLDLLAAQASQPRILSSRFMSPFHGQRRTLF